MLCKVIGKPHLTRVNGELANLPVGSIVDVPESEQAIFPNRLEPVTDKAEAGEKTGDGQ